MKEIIHTTSGTCSRAIRIELDGEIVLDIEFVGGCTGNLQGLSLLARGRKASELADLLEGVQCQNGTSCPDQLAKALRKATVGRKSRSTESKKSKDK